MRHAYERLSARAVLDLAGFGKAASTIVVGYLISGGSGLVTFGLKGIASDLASAAIGSAPGAFLGIRQVIRQRRSRGNFPSFPDPVLNRC